MLAPFVMTSHRFKTVVVLTFTFLAAFVLVEQCVEKQDKMFLWLFLCVKKLEKPFPQSIVRFEGLLRTAFQFGWLCVVRVFIVCFVLVFFVLHAFDFEDGEPGKADVGCAEETPRCPGFDFK